MKKIYVFGSFIMDHTTKCDYPPRDGESVFGSSFAVSYGGKGINQAMMIKRLEGNVTMVGAIGKDDNGCSFIKMMEKEGMDTSKIFKKDISTGVSNIIIDKNGQNRIIVVPGANNELSIEDIKSIKDDIENDSIFLLQNEIPMETIEYIVDIADKKGCLVILNPAPYKEIKKEVLNKIDLITPNEHEASDLFNLKEYDEKTILNRFDDLSCKGIIITLGDKGAIYYDHQEILRFPPFKVKVIDTVGAGDAFNGGLCYGLSKGLNMYDCLTIANVCGALTIQKNGALVSQPSKKEVIDFLNRN